MKNACKKIMALLLVIAMIIGVLPSVFAASYVKPFTDVKTNDWFAEYVKYVYERDPQLMDGVAPDKFDPEGSCTRAMAAVVIYRLADPVKANYKATFTDLTEDWYMDGIGWAQKNKVVDGVGDNKFDPDGLLTREQLVTMIWRYAGEPDASPKNIKSFPDYKEVSDWAVDAFNWAIEEEIIGGSDIEGVDYLLPAGNATRAQFAKIISIYAQSLGCEEHNWDEGVVTKEPTCTEKGEKTLTCKECGETKDVEVPALDHDWDEGAVTKEATCTEEGAKTLTCKRCKETKSEVIPALGHVDEDPADGKCDNCGEDMPAPPSGDFVLSTDLKDGAEVVIYNPGHGMAIKNENDNNWYIVPQTITPADGKIAEPDASLVWTIVDNGNGTYSFVNGENKIMCWVSGNYFELTNDANYANANGNWKILPADAATSQFFIQHESFSNSYGPAYIECYYNAGKDKTNIAGYSSGNPGLADFGFQFYVKGASAPCTDHVDANNDGKCDNCGADITPPPPPSGDFVLSTDLKDGAEVVIYNPGHGMAIKNENDNNWYLVPQTITPADGKIAEPDASLVWTIVDNGNGTYSFVNGENKIMCWVSGNYFELTNDANYANANGNWKILPADAATSQFFIQHESFSNSYGPAYIECYYNAGKDKTNIAGYSSGNPGLADFGFQFYIKGASAPCTDHVDANNDGKCDNCGTELTPPPPPVGDATFTKVTGDQTDWSGTYVIGYTADGKTLIFNGAADADGNHIETVANGDTVTVSTEYAVVVAKSGSGYTFSAKGGYMDGKMYNGSLSNGLAFSASPAVGNMSWNSEKGIVEMQSAQGSIFRYNNGEIQNAPGTFYSWFRFYKPASSVQTPVEFYKLDDASACTHNWNEGVDTTPATCTTAGVKTYTCTLCGATKTEDIPVLSHVDADKDGKCDRCDAAMPVAGSNFVLSTTPEDGDQVVIYNPGHGKAIKNETDRDWYLIAEAITPVDGVITEPDASLVWTYNDNLDGTYSFTNGTDMIVCWVSGNYFELTNDANYANANGNWKIIAADEATSQFYIQHESFSNSYGPAYIECYTKTDGDKISGYSSSNPGLADFGFQFYVLGGEPVVVCPHDWEETDSVDATCTAAGSISYECTLCDATKTDTIAALGHVDDDKDGVCDREGCGYVYPAAGEGYVKVTADQEDWSGTYLIVYEYADGTAKVFNGLDASGEYVTLDSITDNTIAFQEGMCAVVVEKMEGGYSVKVGEQYMYDKGASSNGTNFGATPKATTFASNEDGTVTMTCNTCIFRFNTNSGTNNDRFRYYKSTSTSFPLICLYKLG